jgi:NAD(P)H-hydrate epimerase
MTSPYPCCTPDEIAWLTEAQMIEVDRVMIEDLHIELIQMMENAGRNLAELTIEHFEPLLVTVLAGSGGNGGGGLVAARHLSNRGVAVEVALSSERGHYDGVPGHQLDIVERMGIPIVEVPSHATDLIIDAVIGYSLKGAPRGRALELINAANQHGVPTLSLDTPSGLDVSSGTTLGASVQATATMTLAAPKFGLRDSKNVGDLFVADISVPPKVYERLGLEAAQPFSTPVIRIAHLTVS